MRLGDLPEAEARRRLRGDGLCLVTGLFTTCIQSDIEGLLGDLKAVYDGYPVRLEPGIDDFAVSIRSARRARYRFRPGAEAAIETIPFFEPVPRPLAFVQLESALNWAIGVTLRRYLLLHSAVVERDGVAVLLPGLSGSGKSTLATALVAKGWRLLSDEMALVSPADGRVYPNPRPISLKNEAIEVSRGLLPEARLSRPFEGTAKGRLAFLPAPDEAVARAHEPADPRLIVWPHYNGEHEGPAFFERVDRIQGFTDLVDSAVNYSVLQRTGFDLVTGLIERCRAFRLDYRDLDEALALITGEHDKLGGAEPAA